MNRRRRMSLVLVSALLIGLSGCDQQNAKTFNESTRSDDQISANPTEAEKQRVQEQLLKAIDDAESKAAPTAAFEIPNAEGWTRTEPRALPVDGFSIGYESNTGMSVTLYQFNRGLKTIPANIQSAEVLGEFEDAKSSIMAAVKYGMWDSAKEKDSKNKMLGNSTTNTQWANFSVKKGILRQASEVYVWSYNNQFFKIRLTTSPRRGGSDQVLLDELLTQIGNVTN